MLSNPMFAMKMVTKIHGKSNLSQARTPHLTDIPPRSQNADVL